MVLGFNHNVMYKGEVFHVQTEDSGVANPHIITLLYRGGVILCSKKTSYSDILKMDSLEVVVEELMKEQHKELMRRLKSGEFDEKAFSIKAQLIENYEIPTLEPEADPVAGIFAASTTDSSKKGDISLLFELPQAASAKPEPAKSPSPPPPPPQKAVNLDDAILSFFGKNEK
ncbi:MAG TPA: hypothetical protein HPP76_07985 [Desulfuromonadales bacterium]|nr:hypothetical protein [Desulfuromonadales bacterium]